MIQVKDIIKAIEEIAPLPLQEEWDNCGLQCGDLEQEVDCVLTSLDVYEETLEEARREDAQMIVSHHPILFRGIKSVGEQGLLVPKMIYRAIRQGIALYASHTALDNAAEGVNTILARRLGLENLTLPLPMTGTFPSPLTADELIRRVKEVTGSDCIRCNASGLRPEGARIRKVGLCTGSGGEMIEAAIEAGCDAFLTGEIRYHDFFGHDDILLLAAGHYETEQHTSRLLADILRKAFPALKVIESQTENPVPCR